MSRFRFLMLIVSALAISCGPTKGSAEKIDFAGLSFPAYQAELAIKACGKYLNRYEYVVLAYSPGDRFWCVYGDAGFAASNRIEAVKNCNKNLVAAEAKLTKCRLLMENGKIIDRKYFSTLRSDSRLPVNIEIFDGPTQKATRTTGYLSTGRMLSKTTIEGKLTTSRGAVLCRGKVLYGLSGGRFEGICFDKFKFTGKVPEPSGYMMHEGHLVQRVTMKFQHKDSYIAVSPRD
jgi:hypothetical protein